MDFRQLEISKYLFQKGREELKKKDSLSSGLAVSLFQDSIEILLWTIAKHVEADVREKEAFEAYWEKIKTAKNNPQRNEVPFKAKILELNKARVNFKHYGIVPTLDDVIRFETYAEECLEKSFKSFFGIEMEDVSLAHLITDQAIRDKVISSHNLFKEGKIIDTIISCADVESIISDKLEGVFPPVNSGIKKVNRFLEFAGRSSAISAQGVFDYIYNYLKLLRSLGICSLLRLNISNYLKFKRIYLAAFNRHENLTESDALFCLEYVTDYALIVQEVIGGTPVGTPFLTF